MDVAEQEEGPVRLQVAEAGELANHFQDFYVGTRVNEVVRRQARFLGG